MESEFKIGDRVTITTGILINCGDGVVTAICPHGELLVHLDDSFNRVVRTRMERVIRLDNPPQYVQQSGE